ncbi:hypothetical protein ASF17_14625 [Frigoribacterium sp. Leaf263]|nr:hypothetical protein ASF17_14625 [Frigoribacterium sp. Leaf263]
MSDVTFVVRNSEAKTGFAPRVVLTAPEGTTFPEQATASARYRAAPDGFWGTGAGLDLSNGVVSDGGRTLTFDNSAAPVNISADRDYEYTVKVQTTADALDVSANTMRFVYSGTSAQGAFEATGGAPVSIPGDFGSVSALEVPSIELVRGAVTDVKFVVRNTQAHTIFAPKVVLTAPEGTTFPEQATATSRYRDAPDGEIWGRWDENVLRNGVVSDDGRTLTFDNTGQGISVGANRDYEYTVKVETAADAFDVSGNEMGFVFSGVSAQGNSVPSPRSRSRPRSWFVVRPPM